MRSRSLYAVATTLGLAVTQVAAQQTLWGQCGGIGWTGPTSCVAGAACVSGNDYYYQCLSATGATTTTKPTTTTTKVTTTMTTTTKTTTTTTKTTTAAAASSASSSGWSRTSPPSGALVVRQSGTKSGEYSTISSAVAALGSGTDTKTIFIYQGDYNEKVKITYAGTLKIMGYTTDIRDYKGNTVIVQSSQSQAAAGGADQSAAIWLDKTAANVQVYNLNIKNTAGKVGQAIALSTKGKIAAFYGCLMTSYQDTIYADKGKQYFANCFIEGAVDFIYGAANLLAYKSILSLNGPGAITANGRETTTDTSWYVFDTCTIQKASVIPSGATAPSAGTNYLGRPWQIYARVLYQKCVLPDLINADGWTTMTAGATPLYYEYQNTGAGSSTSNRKYLTSTSVTLSRSSQFGGDLTWIDSSYPL
ncbi:hypothetical protein H072_525 [Dactylellina haptotyla CBS 200.50]|uniref:pectinesterase n=1 Tax=Dactylellina haptotyla (strain CBS 200.50) TaxID=1284197 RepID=S8AR66_DACHA|nr:hypothetical protein H072_525 [Dactylellina haptotyla CBS 200.50]